MNPFLHLLQCDAGFNPTATSAPGSTASINQHSLLPLGSPYLCAVTMHLQAQLFPGKEHLDQQRGPSLHFEEVRVRFLKQIAQFLPGMRGSGTPICKKEWNAA